MRTPSPAFATLAAGIACFCSSAAASGPARLALMPLPLKAIGPDAAGMRLLADSGADSNADAAKHAGRGVTAADLAKAGRVTGYTLDFARPSSPRATQTLVGVQTIAERYRGEATAAAGLAFWRGVTRALDGTKANNLTVDLVPFAARVADGSFAFELTYRLAGKPVLYVGDVVFRTRELLGAVFVTSTGDAGLRTRTVALAERLAARIRDVRAGKIHS